jgi:hypothetical protein
MSGDSESVRRDGRDAWDASSSTSFCSFQEKVEKLARERSILASNATPSHSLLSAGKKSLTPKAVADNFIKPAEADRAENPLNWDVERLRSRGHYKNGP